MSPYTTERRLPRPYIDYLDRLPHYSARTVRQKTGRVLFAATWLPFLLTLFVGSRVFADKNGKFPHWLLVAQRHLFSMMWGSYDNFFKRVFGRGE